MSKLPVHKSIQKAGKLDLEEMKYWLEDFTSFSTDRNVAVNALNLFRHLDKLGNVRMPDFIEPHPWAVEWYWYSRPELELVTLLWVHAEGIWIFGYSDEKEGWCEVSGTTGYDNIPQKVLDLIGVK